MAESAIACLLKELSIFLLHQKSNPVQRDVQFIKDELSSMLAFLKDAEAKEDDVSELQEWIRQVREVAFDTEDVLDEFMIRFARHNAHGFQGRVRKIYSSIKNMRAGHRISSEITNIKSRVEDISRRHQRYQSTYGNQEAGSSSSLVRNLHNDIRASSILIEEAKLVGIDKPKRELISQILDHNSHLKAIAVVGMGGLGKTTLVRKVYDDAAVKKQFQCHAWLTISQSFQIMAAIKDLIQQLFDEINKQVPPEVVRSTDLVMLSAFVRYFLQQRRYIFVFDDLWSTGSWEALKYVLPDDNTYSRVILTTRIADVASAACLRSHDSVHWMKPLSVEECRILFCNRTFQRNQCPQDLEDVLTSILKKCEGLPLAIVAIAGVLRLKERNRKYEWEKILQSLGGAIEGSDKLESIKRILFLSYNDLPHCLKSCLLHLSIYPEDHKIKVEDLLDKWIAQGFVQEKEEMSSTDVAAEYANELINRSLIQVASTFSDGTLYFCRVHDFLRDMIVAKSKEQNFTAIAAGYFNGRRPDKVRRLAIHGFVDNPQPQELHRCFKSLRSLEFFGYKSPLSAPQVSRFLCGGSKLLKVLDLSGAPLEDIPKEVFNLFHLKHLCLRYTQVEIIPNSIGNLQNLEYFDLSQTKVTEVPVQILKLKKLSSIFVSRLGDYSENFALRGFKSPDGIGQLISLENLRAIEVDNHKIVRDIGKLTKLMKLTITKLRREDGREFLSSLAKLTNLRELSLSSSKEDETLDLQYPMSPTPRFLKWLALQGRLERVPQWVISLQGLTTLYLQYSGLPEDEAPGGIGSLQDLPNLVSLTINDAYGWERLRYRTGGFQKLQVLELVKLERLKWVVVEEGPMPNLQRLIITGCKLIQALPLGTEGLRRLKDLELNDMSHELIQKLLKIGRLSEDYQKIAHIPEVCIGHWINGGWKLHFL